VKRLIATMIVLASSMALAQPMMVDPSKMSGIPRPDPKVPPKTVTVRLIRGELSNRMVGMDVGLTDGKSPAVIQKTDAEGRATFSNLKGPGPYMAKATDGVEELTSQPIELPGDMGVRVMLVFQPQGGVADGTARPDKQLPGGTLVVKAVGESGTPEKGLEVLLGMARQGEESVRETRSKTNDDGEAKFTGLDSKPTSGYLIEVVKGAGKFASKPFTMQENMGLRVTVDVRPVSQDVSKLHIGNGSHFIYEITDDVVQVVEVIRLANEGTSAIDPGPNGLHLPLPDHALSAQAGPRNPPGLTVAGHEAVLKGTIQPGDTELQVMFALAYDGSDLDFTQRTPIAFENVAMVSEKIEGMTIEGNSLAAEERELQGRKLMLYRGPGTKAGESIELHFRGLPHSDATWRYVAVVVALGILIGFFAFASRGVAPRVNREKLEQQREHLLGELAAVDKSAGDEAKRERKRQELTARLVRVYRELDEVAR
jgi:hypothetical protein